ncbi:MAG: BrnA antitoxin family protein [Pseudomonadota bacterium]|jgi:uncharacterized protein (DUF4415 family)
MPKRPNPEKIDAEVPELDDAFFERARPAGQALGPAFLLKAKRAPGRPKVDEPKEPVSIRLRPDVLKHLRSSGAGWQTRVDEALAKLIAEGRL